MKVKNKLKDEYKLKGRYKRAKESYKSNFCNLGKYELFKQTIKCFFDTPSCSCPEYCTIHKNNKK